MDVDRATLKNWLWNLTLDPLDPCAPEEVRYVALTDAGRGAVEEIHSLIELSTEPTVQLLSGPSGSGKTTELLGLKGRLEQAGFSALVIDVLDYVSQSSEIDIVEVLITIALAMEDGFRSSAGHVGGRGWTQRLQDFLKRINVTVGTGLMNAQLSAEGVSAEAMGISVGIDLKEELKSSQPFVEELRDKLGFYLGDLRREVAEHCQEVVRAHLQSGGAEGVVMILDSLEKIRGTTANDERVQESVKRALVQHAEKLRFASHHMVYTVPPYLLFTDSGALPFDGAVRAVPIPHVTDRDGAVVETNVRQLITVVEQRIPWRELLASEEALRSVILASGGHLKDLFRILRELIMLLNARKAPLPATEEQVAEGISKVAFGFSSITAEDAAFLERVHETGGDIRPEQQHIGRLARLLHSHMVLAHLNGGLWYEVHPLARRALGLG